MISWARSTALAAALLVPGLAGASASLVLTDGQVIKGTAVTRQGDVYLVTMSGGTKVAFPAALVAKIDIEDDPKPAAPPGYDYSGPKTLAGDPERASQDRKDQLRVLGPPAQWSKDVIDPTWVPTSGFDLDKDVLAGSRSTWSNNAIDTTWKPTSAFDLGKDVLAGSRSTWSKNAIDTTWKPTDGFGFKPLSFNPPGSRPQDSGQAPAPTLSPWACAERLFGGDGGKRPASLSVGKANDAAYGSLGMTLYEASGMIGGASRKAIFTIAGDDCRLIGGDTEALVGLNLTDDHAIVQNTAAFNAAIGPAGGARPREGGDKLDYALAFVSLTDPTVSGAPHATLKLISKPEDLRSIAAKAPSTCSLSKTKRRREERAATGAFAAPKVAAGKEGDVVTFLTWSSAGGNVYRNTVVLARGGGGVSAKRDTVATHVGAHKD